MSADTAPAAPASQAGLSLWQDAYRRLKKDRLAVLCFLVIVAYVVVALMARSGQFMNYLHDEGKVGDTAKAFADTVLFATYEDADRELGRVWPGFAHPFGTNVQGQDIMARIANGTGIAISLALSVSLLAIVIGSVLGSLAGWFGGWVDDVIVWLYSTVSSIPSIMLIMALAYLLKGQVPPFAAVFLAMGLTYWVGVCRIVRGEFLKLRDRDYVLAARATGLRDGRIMLGHVLPNTAHLLIISFTLLFVYAIKAEVIISFLGVGFTNEPSWGLLISDAEAELTKGYWWQMTFTAVALFGIVLAFQVFGDSLRDALDPRLRT